MALGPDTISVAVVGDDEEAQSVAIDALKAASSTGRSYFLARRLWCSHTMLRAWRTDVRKQVQGTDVAVLVITRSALDLPSFRWIADLLARESTPAIPLIDKTVPLSRLKTLFAKANIDWVHSLPIARRADDLVDDFPAWEQALGEGVKQGTQPIGRRRPAREILGAIRQGVGITRLHASVASDPVSAPIADSILQVYPIDRDATDNPGATALSAAALREERLPTLRAELERYIREFRQAQPGPRDRVDCSVYAPSELPRNRPFKIQALLNREDQLIDAARLIDVGGFAPQKYVSDSLRLEIRRGTRIDFELSCRALSLEDPVRSITWSGQARAATWSVKGVLPTVKNILTARLEASVDGIAVGRYEFEMPLAERQRAETPSMALLHGAARAYRSAFISYARENFEQASYFAECLEDMNVKLLMDLITMRSGYHWESWIGESIPTADAFFLIWSQYASRSDWVQNECCMAYEAWKSGGRPDILPKLMERPAPPLPPYLSHLHVSGKYLALRMAEKHPLFLGGT